MILKAILLQLSAESDSKNGILYYIDQPIETEYRMGQYISNDPDLSDFTQLMIETGLLDPNFEESDTKNQIS